MILTRIVARNFRRLRSAEIGLAPGLNIVRGPNEAGKSTVQEVIRAALFEDPAGTRMQRGDLANWQTGQGPQCSCAYRIGDKQYILEKAADAKSTVLHCPATDERWEGRKRAEQVLQDTAHLGGQKAYEATACLLQQQLAQLQAGAEVRELLQRTLTGGADDASAQAVRRDLDRQLTELSRPRARDGKLDRARAGLQVHRDDLARVNAELAQLDEQRHTVQQAAADLAALREDQAARRTLLERAQRRRELDDDHARLYKECQALVATVTEGRDLQARIAQLQAPAADGLSVTTEQRNAALHLQADAGRYEQVIPNTTEQLSWLQKEAAEAEQAAQSLRQTVPAEADQAEAQALETDTRVLGEKLKEMEARESALVRAREGAKRLRTSLVVAGLIAVALGVLIWQTAVQNALASGLAALMVVLGAGVLVAQLVRLLTKSPGTLAEPEQSAADTALELRQKEARIQTIWHSLGCATGAQWRTQLQQATRQLEEADARANTLGGTLQARREELARLEGETALVARQTQELLSATGFSDLDTLLSATAQRDEDIRLAENIANRLNGLLAGRELAELEENLRRLNLDRMARADGLKAQDAQGPALDPLEYVRQQDEVNRLDQAIRELDTSALQAEAVVRNSDLDVEDATRLENEVAELAERVKRLERHQKALALAAEVLDEARQQATANALDLLGPKLDDYLRRLTGDRYSRTTVSPDDLSVRVYSTEREGEVDPDSDLSLATREQVYLAARLALASLLWSTGGPPILLDDPLVNFDEQRRRWALELLRDIARTRQVILFTCSTDYDWAADNVVDLPGPATATA